MGIEEVNIPTEIEADGFITPPRALEQKTADTATPVKPCLYPRCEECDKYHGHYCTVPVVFSKQYSLVLDDFMEKTVRWLTNLEKLVTDEILGSDEPCVQMDDNLNLTWADVLLDED